MYSRQCRRVYSTKIRLISFFSHSRSGCVGSLLRSNRGVISSHSPPANFFFGRTFDLAGRVLLMRSNDKGWSNQRMQLDNISIHLYLPKETRRTRQFLRSAVTSGMI